jgi:hypothetical protein
MRPGTTPELMGHIAQQQQHPYLPPRRGSADDDGRSTASFGSGPLPLNKPASSSNQVAWTGSPQVDHEAFHRMLAEHRDAKAQQRADQLKIRQLRRYGGVWGVLWCCLFFG